MDEGIQEEGSTYTWSDTIIIIMINWEIVFDL
jgi:hypothetical protein